MEELLFLCHRIPYPPNKGDKIRSYNLLRKLSEKYRILLGTFIDDPEDWKYLEILNRFCVDIKAVKLEPKYAKIRSLSGLISGAALTIPYYYDDNLSKWVDAIFSKKKISRVFVFSSSMAQYAYSHIGGDVHGVVDFVDVDSDKWLQYSKGKYWPLSWLYKRESSTLLEYEGKVARKFDASFFVSEDEAGLFRKLVPTVVDKVSSIENGVDTKYFFPDKEYKNPYPTNKKILVFTGAMDYWANVDAVTWFATEVFPIVEDRYKDVVFFIVGSRPTDVVQKLADDNERIVVTGKVDDIRPYIACSTIAVAPLRIARGIQNKVLEAMAMAKSVAMTQQAVAGIDIPVSLQSLVVNSAEDMAAKIMDLLQAKEEREKIGAASRKFVCERYGWDRNLSIIDNIFEKLE